MSRNASRALRRAVADLAGVELADMRAILDQLEPHERRRIETLLREFAGLAGEVATPLGDLFKTAPDWILARIAVSMSADALEPELAKVHAHKAQRLQLLSAALRITPTASLRLRDLAIAHAGTPGEKNSGRARPVIGARA